VMAYDRTTRKSTVTETIQKQFRVDRFDFSFLSQIWAARAREVAKRKITDVQNWLKASSTRTTNF
jgi:hypothetical protein